MGGARGHDVALALSIGSAAIDEDRAEVARPMLEWAKHQAPRITAIREAYGVALYLAEDYPAALTELQAYRRMTSRNDQNHLIADCMRALGRDVDRVVEVAAQLVGESSAPEERRVEAAIVWAGALDDRGDLAGARAVLRRLLDEPGRGREEHDLRLRYMAADLAAKAGDEATAVGQLEMIVRIEPGFLDAADRLEALTR